MDVRSCCLSLLLLLAVNWGGEALEKRHATRGRIRSLFEKRHPELAMEKEKHSRMEEVVQQIAKIRSRRQATGSPMPHGDHPFTNDNNLFARIYYSGNTSPVIFVLTYNSRTNPTRTNVYRSKNYGASFDKINSTVGSPLWNDFYASPTSKLVVFYHSTRPEIYISRDEGINWSTQSLSPNTIDPRSFVWNPREEQSAIAYDRTNNIIYVTQDLGRSWTKISNNVGSRFDYQWGNDYDEDSSVIYFNSYDPNDQNRGNYTVGLYSQRAPYTGITRREFDPSLGRHDDFLLLGPYIFAQRNDSGIIHLYISYMRQPFNRAKIPTTDPHANYYVGHINELQALVIVEHVSGRFNLYLSDITGVYFSLSLEDIVVVTNRGIDLERIDGINGTMIANRYMRLNSTTTVTRTVVTLDNGGEWSYVNPPDLYLNNTPVLCEPPSCSLHFHMDTSEYARLGVYSQASAPGIIIAHGNIGGQVSDNPDLYISRDGGVSWSQTLLGSWGVTVVDHGGLLVAADDYHNRPSGVLKYSCDEGLSWRDFTYTTTNMTVFGVITEPGEETTTVSLYGIKVGTRFWDVVTVNFSSIFDRTCTSNDFYLWQPWDARTDSDCILGLDVTLERRIPQRCCLIGVNYDRPIDSRVCECAIDDYECDFGFMPADGFSGPCVQDPAIPLDDPCADGRLKTVMKSRGYRKIPGDICTRGELDFEPYQFTCCNVSILNRIISTSNSAVVGLSVVLGLAILVALALGVALAVVILRRSHRSSARVQFTSYTRGGEDSERLLTNDDVRDDYDDDDPPLAL